MKLACIIHRYGADVAGGSEAHCRALAHRLAAHHEVTVVTSCARDYVTWRNAYGSGLSLDGPVRVYRFPVARERNLRQLRALTDLVFSGRATESEQEEWFRVNGPDVPDVLSCLERRGKEFDRVLFWSYRYAPTFFGVPFVADRAILLPTAEADPLIRADVLGPFFAKPAGYLFLTPEEAELVATRCEGPLPKSATIGVGLEPVETPLRAAPSPGAVPSILYLGRIDRNKGCDMLLHHFDRYVGERGRNVELVMAGPLMMPAQFGPSVRHLGHVDDATRDALLSGTRALVVPSPYESLSMVLLEAWNRGVPTLVNAWCNVLDGQTLRAGGGLCYANYHEFAAGLDFLLEEPDTARQLGAQGLAYVDREYRWPVVMGKVERLLQDVGPEATA